MLPSIGDCTKTTISNGASIWRCEISLIAFHICKKNVYMNVKIPVEILVLRERGAWRSGRTRLFLSQRKKLKIQLID
jgi:hypothetical protein